MWNKLSCITPRLHWGYPINSVLKAKEISLTSGISSHITMFAPIPISYQHCKLIMQLSYNGCRSDMPEVMVFNSSPLDKMAANLADDIFKYIFMNERFCISIRILLKFVSMGEIDNRTALVQAMAWRRAGDKPLTDSSLTHVCGTREKWVKPLTIK